MMKLMICQLLLKTKLILLKTQINFHGKIVWVRKDNFPSIKEAKRQMRCIIKKLQKLRILRFKNLEQMQILQKGELIGINFGNNQKAVKMKKSKD